MTPDGHCEGLRVGHGQSMEYSCIKPAGQVRHNLGCEREARIRTRQQAPPCRNVPVTRRTTANTRNTQHPLPVPVPQPHRFTAVSLIIPHTKGSYHTASPSMPEQEPELEPEPTTDSKGRPFMCVCPAIRSLARAAALARTCFGISLVLLTRAICCYLPQYEGTDCSKERSLRCLDGPPWQGVQRL